MLERPIFIIGTPRSGTTLLYRTLSLHPELWSLETESHFILEGPLYPDLKKGESNRPNANHLDDERMHEVLRQKFFKNAVNIDQWFDEKSAVKEYIYSANNISQRVIRKGIVESIRLISKLSHSQKTIRFLEKTPKNSLRVSFLNRVFPDALFIWLLRDPIDNIQSLVKGWRTNDSLGPLNIPRFNRFGYRLPKGFSISGYNGDKWNFALVPEWPQLNGKTLLEVATWQYYMCNKCALDDFANIDEERVFKIKFDELLSSPADLITDIFKWADLKSQDVDIFQELPKINTTKNDKYIEKKFVKETISQTEGFQKLIDQLGFKPDLNE